MIPADSNPSGRSGLAEVIGLVVLVLLTILPAFLAYPFPSLDGHLHSASAFAFSRTGDAALGLGYFLEPNFPLSGQGWVFLLVGLDQLLPFPVAERLALALLLAAFPLVGIVFARFSGRRAWPVAAVLCLVAHSWVLAMGFWSFMLGMALTPLACVVAGRLGGRGPTVARVLGLAAILLVLAWVHLFSAAFGGILAAVVALGAALEARAEDPKRLTARDIALRLGLVALVGVPALAYVISVSHGFMGPASVSPGGTVFEPFLTRIADAFRLGPGGWSAMTGVVFAGAAAWVGVQAFRGGRGRWVARLLVGTAAALLIVYLFAPIRAYKWAFLSPRLLFAAMIALALAASAARLSTRANLAALVCVAVALCFSTASMARSAAEVAPLAEAVSRLRRVPGSTFVPLQFAPERMVTAPRHVNLTIHLGTRAMFTSGGVTPYLFAVNPSTHALRFRQPLQRLRGRPPPVYGYLAFRCRSDSAPGCAARQRRYADRIALAALPWKELVLFHPPPRLSERLAYRGYQRLPGSAAVEHWRARPAWAEVPADIAPGGPVLEARVRLLPGVGCPSHGAG